jgi:hypothetical protein
MCFVAASRLIARRRLETVEPRPHDVHQNEVGHREPRFTIASSPLSHETTSYPAFVKSEFSTCRSSASRRR